MHSVISLSTTLKVNRRRISRLLQQLGLVPQGGTDGEAGRLVFPIEEVAKHVRDCETAVPLAHVSDYIGCSHSQALALYQAGILSPLIPADAPGAVRRIIFARRILDELLERIAELPLPDDTLHEDVLSIAETCQRHGGRTAELTKAVLEGKVVGFRLHAVRVSTFGLRTSRKQGMTSSGLTWSSGAFLNVCATGLANAGLFSSADLTRGQIFAPSLQTFDRRSLMTIVVAV